MVSDHHADDRPNYEGLQCNNAIPSVHWYWCKYSQAVSPNITLTTDQATKDCNATSPPLLLSGAAVSPKSDPCVSPRSRASSHYLTDDRPSYEGLQMRRRYHSESPAAFTSVDIGVGAGGVDAYMECIRQQQGLNNQRHHPSGIHVSGVATGVSPTN